MYIKPLFKKPKHDSELSPKDWICEKPRLAHIISHTYNAERFFQLPGVAPKVKKLIHVNAKKYKINLFKIGCDYTHIHYIIKQCPEQNLRKIVGQLKGKTSFDIRNSVPWLKRYPHFWAKGFYVTFWREEELDIVYKYLENQIREQEERFNNCVASK